MKIFNPLNYNQRQVQGKKFTQPSMAVPDQTLSVREIFTRFANGQDLGGAKPAIWEDEPSNGINPKTLDLVDLQEMKMRNEEKLDKMLKEQKKAKKEAKVEAVDAEILKEQH